MAKATAFKPRSRTLDVPPQPRPSWSPTSRRPSAHADRSDLERELRFIKLRLVSRVYQSKLTRSLPVQVNRHRDWGKCTPCSERPLGAPAGRAGPVRGLSGAAVGLALIRQTGSRVHVRTSWVHHVPGFDSDRHAAELHHERNVQKCANLS